MDGQNSVRFARSDSSKLAQPRSVHRDPGYLRGTRAAARDIAEQVDVGPLERARWALDVNSAYHARQPEAARLTAVEIVSHDVPAAPP